MAKEFLLIDGYNLLHAAGMVPRHVDAQVLLRSRHRLLKFLETRLTLDERSRSTIVFDIRDGDRDVPKQQDHAGICVMYAVDHPDADSMIEELLLQHSAPKQLTVVSSDHRLQRASKKRRSHSMDSDVFFEELNQRPGLLDQEASTQNTIEDSQTFLIDDQELKLWESRVNQLFDG